MKRIEVGSKRDLSMSSVVGKKAVSLRVIGGLLMNPSSDARNSQEFPNSKIKITKLTSSI